MRGRLARTTILALAIGCTEASEEPAPEVPADAATRAEEPAPPEQRAADRGVGVGDDVIAQLTGQGGETASVHPIATAAAGDGEE